MIKPRRLTRRIREVKPSFTLAMATRATEMREAGEPVINFSVGEPDFNTPDHICEAAFQAIRDGHTKYTAGSGVFAFRKAICDKLKRENGLNYEPDQILVSNGEKHSLFTACQVLFEEGDKVIVFTPYWVSFPEFVKLAGAEPVLVPTLPDKQFEPDFEALEKAITPEVRGVIINSPSNPTGGIWSIEAMEKILKIGKDNDWTIISDECYERLVYDKEFVSLEKINTIGADVLSCFSLSKTYAMTGWRIGYCAGERSLIKAMSKHQGQATSCANSIGQMAGITALSGDQTCVDDMRVAFLERRNLMVDLLNEIPDVTCAYPGGAFYAFPDLSAYLNTTVNGKIIKDSFDLSEYILDSAKVVTIPGDGFGAPGYVRFSFAAGNEIIREGIGRVKKVLIELR